MQCLLTARGGKVSFARALARSHTAPRGRVERWLTRRLRLAQARRIVSSGDSVYSQRTLPSLQHQPPSPPPQLHHVLVCHSLCRDRLQWAGSCRECSGRFTLSHAVFTALSKSMSCEDEIEHSLLRSDPQVLRVVRELGLEVSTAPHTQLEWIAIPNAYLEHHRVRVNGMGSEFVELDHMSYLRAMLHSDQFSDVAKLRYAQRVTEEAVTGKMKTIYVAPSRQPAPGGFANP